MQNIALYRKYRPTTLEDLIGQDIISKILKEAAKQDRLAHAYLFSGPRGTGKTSTARLVAKLANCKTRANDAKHKAKGEPCNTCPACKAIDENRALDVIEIDAASNRGIDEMRALKENVRVAPTALQRKVFIIAEAHMLTKEAANALLKTLEEPPAYVTIILATTEIEKIPATIASRTQTFQFKHVPLKEVVKKLQKITAEEKLKISDDALELIAAAGEGSFRDAESLLDQMISMSEGEISTEAVERTLGKLGFKKISDLAESLLKNNLDEALKNLSAIQEEGHNIVELLKDLILHLRKTAVLAKSPNMHEKFAEQLPADQINILEEHAKLWQARPVRDRSSSDDRSEAVSNGDAHLELLKNLIKAHSQMRYSSFPQIPLEIAIIESLQK